MIKMNRKNLLVIVGVVLIAAGIYMYNQDDSYLSTDVPLPNGEICYDDLECESGRCNICNKCQAKRPEDLDGDMGSSCMKDEDCGEYSCTSGYFSTTQCCDTGTAKLKVCAKWEDCKTKSLEVIR